MKKEINNIVYWLFLKLHTHKSFLNSNYLAYIRCMSGPFVSIKTKKLISKTFFKFVVTCKFLLSFYLKLFTTHMQVIFFKLYNIFLWFWVIFLFEVIQKITWKTLCDFNSKVILSDFEGFFCDFLWFQVIFCDFWVILSDFLWFTSDFQCLKNHKKSLSDSWTKSLRSLCADVGASVENDVSRVGESKHCQKQP